MAKQLRYKLTTSSSPPRLADRRTHAARRYEEIVKRVLHDMGGEVNQTEIKVQLVRRFAAVTVLAEGIESDLLSGKPIDGQRFVSLLALVMRLGSKLGLRSSDDDKDDDGPTLQDVFAEIEANNAQRSSPVSMSHEGVIDVLLRRSLLASQPLR
jgi:hypothetical protein